MTARNPINLDYQFDTSGIDWNSLPTDTATDAHDSGLSGSLETMRNAVHDPNATFGDSLGTPIDTRTIGAKFPLTKEPLELDPSTQAYIDQKLAEIFRSQIGRQIEDGQIKPGGDAEEKVQNFVKYTTALRAGGWGLVAYTAFRPDRIGRTIDVGLYGEGGSDAKLRLYKNSDEANYSIQKLDQGWFGNSWETIGAAVPTDLLP